jgi:histidine phosphotransferase ChpT
MHDAADDMPALVASRICHDLISPLGAIGNGIELMALESGTQSAEMALVSESVRNASARLRFFRIAFGQALPHQPAAAGELLPVLTDLGRAGRVEFHWRVAGSVLRVEAKLAFLSILCIEAALPYGGTITVLRDGDLWTVAGTGRELRYDQALWGRLRRDGAAIAASGDAGRPDISPAQIQFVLLPAEILAHERRLALELEEGQAVLRF